MPASDIAPATGSSTSPPVSDSDPVISSPTPSYWLLKIREQTWEIRDFSVGEATWFTTYTLASGKRQEYALYLTLHAGDLLLVYAYESYHAVVGIMEVTEGAHTDPGKGEVISMKIKELFDPYIPIEAFYPGISAGDQLTAEDPRRLVSITAAEYNPNSRAKKSKTSGSILAPGLYFGRKSFQYAG